VAGNDIEMIDKIEVGRVYQRSFFAADLWSVAE